MSGSGLPLNVAYSAGGLPDPAQALETYPVTTLTSAQIVAGYIIPAGVLNGLYTIPVLTGAGTITLPPVAQCKGCRFEFRAVGTLGNACVITGATARVGGMVLTTTGSASAGATLSYFTAGLTNASVTMTATAVASDSVVITSDGVSYFANGMSHAAAGLTIP